MATAVSSSSPSPIEVRLERERERDKTPGALGVRTQTDMGYPGDGPWAFTLLREPHLSRELERVSAPRTYTLGGGKSNESSNSEGGRKNFEGGNASPRRAYSVSMQPCLDPDQASQDRLLVESWMMPDGEWVFTGVFDGHAGHDTANFTVSRLPVLIRDALERAFKASNPPSVDAVSTLLRDTISGLDQSLTDALLALFPNVDAINALSDAQIQERIRDKDRGGAAAAAVARCMQGTTALVALTDPQCGNLWVASLGDCVAVLGSENGNDVRVVSTTHNGQIQAEADRIRREHPGEDEAILRHRVLGALAVTRAIGDHLFKVPSQYTTRVFSNSAAGFRISTPLQDIIPRIKTPPYVSSVPDVTHVALRDATSGVAAGQQHFLILASDGLVELFHQSVDARVWASYVRDALVASASSPGKAWKERNPALTLLRRGLGGDSEEHVSRMLTVEMAERWMDDTSIIVLTL